MFDTDVFVLGGGPAGLAAAIAACAKGLNVTLAEAEKPPIDKACGEGLMPDSLAAAAALGVVVEPEHGCRFRGIRFQGEFNSITSEFPDGCGIGVRRPMLQGLLIERAEAIGVRLLWGARVRSVDRHTIDLGSVKVNTRWIVGADGTQSRLRRWTGLNHLVRNSERFSYRRHYRVAPWSDYMEIHWSHGCQFYVTPVGQTEVCLVLMSRDPQQRISQALAAFPPLQAHLLGAGPTTPERGAIAATRKLSRVTTGNVALVGDASGTVDPITGEGLCLAFKQATLLADSLAEGDLAAYEKAHRNMLRRARFMSDFMLLMDRSTILQRRTLKSFERSPRLFSNLLAMHVGQLGPAGFLKTAAELGWQVATA